MFKRIYVWELPVRILHWLHVASIFVLAITGIYIGEPFIGLALGQNVRLYVTDWVRAIHFVASYVFGLGFLVRFYWFVAGNEYASWRGWVPIGRERWASLWHQLKYYLFLERKRPEYLGHNPVAGLTYVLLGVMIVLQGFTGLAMYAAPYPNGFWRVTFGWLLVLVGDQTLRLIHHLQMYLLGVFFLIHFYMAVVADIEERNGTLTSIISGVKFDFVQRE